MKQELSTKYNVLALLSFLLLFLVSFYLGVLSFNRSHFVFSLIIWICLFFFILICCRHYPKIFTITREGVKVSSLLKSTLYPWESVKQIAVTSDEYFPFLLIPRPGDAVCIRLKNGEKLKIGTFWYSNIAHLRVVFERANAIFFSIEKDFASLDFSKFTSPKFDKRLTRHGSQLVFKKKPFSKVNRHGFYVALALIWFLPVLIDKEDGLVAGSLLACITFLMVGVRANYFIILDDSFFVVKNSIFFWIHKAYLIKHIKEAVFIEGTSRGPSNNITLIFDNYEEETFQSENLQEETWTNLFKYLQSRGISTRIHGTYLN